MSLANNIAIVGHHSNVDQVSALYDNLVNALGCKNSPSVLLIENEPVVRVMAYKAMEMIANAESRPSIVIAIMPPITNYLLDTGTYGIWDNDKLSFYIPDKNGKPSNKQAIIIDYINRKYDISIEMASFYSYVSLDILDNMLSSIGIRFLFTFLDDESSYVTKKLPRFLSFTQIDDVVGRLSHVCSMGN